MKQQHLLQSCSIEAMKTTADTDWRPADVSDHYHVEMSQSETGAEKLTTKHHLLAVTSL